MSTLLLIITFTLFISLFSLAGVFTLAIKHKELDKFLLFLVSLSTGALMGGAFFHLLPEALEEGGSENIFGIVLLAFVVFYVIEKIFHWRHCHKSEECDVHHTFGYMNLVGDSIHNFIDGLVIASTFAVDVRLGIITFLAVAFHEIPQEIGDFGVLLYSGFEKKKALILNFGVSLMVVLGGIFGYFLSGYIENAKSFLLPFAAGGFLYVSASDLIPEIRKEVSITKSAISFSVFLAGLLLMYLVKFLGE